MPSANFGWLERYWMRRLDKEEIWAFTKIASVLSGCTGSINLSTSNPCLTKWVPVSFSRFEGAFVGGHFRKIVLDAAAISLSYLCVIPSPVYAVPMYCVIVPYMQTTLSVRMNIVCLNNKKKHILIGLCSLFV